MGECSSTPPHLRSHGPPPSHEADKQLWWYVLIRLQANPPNHPALKSGIHPRASTQNLPSRPRPLGHQPQYRSAQIQEDLWPLLPSPWP